MLSGMGYNSRYEKIPNTPRMRGGFRDFRVTTSGNTATITWHDYDGEYSQLMEVMRKQPGGAWQPWQTIRPEDEEADYSIDDTEYTDGTRYRLHIRSFSGRDYYSSQDMEPGEALEMGDGTLRYVGGNLALNGQFRLGMTGWTGGTGKPIAQPWFEVFPMSLTDGYFLQAFANKGKDHEGSLLTAFDIVPQQDYVLRLASQNAGNYMKLDVRKKGETADANRLTMKNYTYWATQQGIFNAGDYDEALLSFRWLAATARIGDIELCRLFNTREEAIADGVTQMRRKVQMVKDWNTALPGLNDELQQRADNAQGTDDEQLAALQLAVNDLLQAVSDRQAIDSLLTVARTVSHMNFAGRDELQDAIAAAEDVAQNSTDLAETRLTLQQALDNFVSMSPASKQPQSPTFATTDGWTVKTGTYTAGDQRTATQQGLSCWNAWWDAIDAAEGGAKTMSIEQKLVGLDEGLYWLQCKAATQHYCLSDQHAFVTVRQKDHTDYADSQVTPCLQRDYLDIQGTLSAWQTLTSTPVYVGTTDTLCIGFTSSKQGATDYAWRRYGNAETDNNSGDRREGWWCATDFQLLYHPIKKLTTTPGHFATVCLPYAYQLPEGARFYQVAGLLADYSAVCLEQVTQVETGYPYIFVSDEASDITFYTYGQRLTRPVTTGTNNLAGSFATIARVAEGSYVLHDDGEWYRVEGDRPSFQPFTCVIRRAAGMPILESWSGITMPIHGVQAELGDPDTIGSVTTKTTNTTYYRLDGSRSDTQPAGLHIQTNGTTTRKVMGR